MVSRAVIMSKKFLFFIVLVVVSEMTATGFGVRIGQTFRRPLKILCVLGSFPLLPEIYVVNQLIGLIDRGHEVYIYANRKGQSIVHPAVEKYNLLKRAYYKELPRDIHTYDIIICQFGPLGKNFVKIKKQLGLKAKIITCFRGYDISREIKSKGKHTYDSLFEEGDYFLPVCKYFKNILIKLGCPAHKIRVHHSAIDLQRFALRSDRRSERNGVTANFDSMVSESFDSGVSENFDSDVRDSFDSNVNKYDLNKHKEEKKITIVSVNRLVPKKGTIYSILAIISLLKKYPQIEYYVMGGGPLHDRLMSVIR